jgi:FkbH-like protein
MTASPSIMENLAPTPAAYLQAARRVQAGEITGLRALRVAVLSTVSAQLLQPYLIVQGARCGLQITPWFAPFGQLEVPALDVQGPLYSEKPDAIVILARFDELAPDFSGQFPAGGEETAVIHDKVSERLCALLRNLRDRTAAALFVANFAPPEHLSCGVGDTMLELSQTAAIHRVNAALATACRSISGAFIFDYARLVAEHGLRGWHDPRMLAMARQPWSVAAQIAIASSMMRTIRAAFVAPAKCLVLDADNTLWGGVIGEEGLGGIALGDEYPGNVFKAFQKYLRALKARGILLALASKNEEGEVFAVLDQHADSILHREDFAVMRINWQEKSVNLREIAAALNIGLDALVLFDDNPFEREEVRQALPEVTVLDVPDDSLRYITTLAESPAFDQLTFSAEDQQRTDLYGQQRAHTEASHAAASPEEFLASLGMVATIGRVGPETLPRVAQLLAKTNQFNLTTRRHSAAQISEMIESGAVGLWLRLADRFGDHGLVGVAIARPAQKQWEIDTFLLSCRVIGRGVETALLAQLSTVVKAQGGEKLLGEYRPSAKNGIVSDFYARHGFVECGGNHWQKSLSGSAAAAPYIGVHFHE